MLPSASHANGAGGPLVGDGEVDEAADERVGDDRDDRRDVLGRDLRVVQRGHGGPEVARDQRELLGVGRPDDRRAQVEGRAALGRDEVDVVDDPEERAGRRQHREVADAAVEHLDEHLAGHAVAGDGVRGRAHDLRDGGVGRQAGGQDARAQVAVGEDPEASVAQLHDGARLARVGHVARHGRDRRVGPAAHRGRAQQRRDRPLGGGLARARHPGRRPPEERARDVPQRLRPREQRAGDVAREAVALRLAAGARGEAGGQLREHRGEAEQLAGTEEVEHAAVVDELDAPRADDPHARLRRRALGEDRLAVGERADLRRAGEPRELVRREGVERRVRPQELGDLVHRPSRRRPGLYLRSAPAPRRSRRGARAAARPACRAARSSSTPSRRSGTPR